MGVIDVRLFNVATCFGASGELEVANVSFVDEDMWDVDLAIVVAVNALAVPGDRNLTYRVMQNELRLLLSFLMDQPGSPLTVRHAEFRASSGHVKRFISESFGLGMLTAAAERHHKWKLRNSGLHNFDVLPANVAAQYSGSGIRPDLLFEFTGQEPMTRLAGEARGRSSARPLNPTSKDQENRLADIVAWSGMNGLHPVTMTYAYTGAANAQVDLFDITAPDNLDTASEITFVDEQGLAEAETGRRFELLTFVRARALNRASEVTEQLYETAPQDAPGPTRTVYGRNVRGTWAVADLITSSRLRFFLGLLDRPLTPEQAVAARQRYRVSGQPDADPIQVATIGRIFIVVARDAAEDPDWYEVTSRIE